jgi:hypothetical protein
MAKKARRPGRRPPLTVAEVLAWADAHRAHTGAWPGTAGGPVLACPGVTWRQIDNALRLGLRGLPGGSSLPRLLERARCAPARRGRRVSARARQALALRRQGLTLKEIGRQLGVSFQCVWQMLRRLAGRRRPRGEVTWAGGPPLACRDKRQGAGPPMPQG